MVKTPYNGLKEGGLRMEVATKERYTYQDYLKLEDDKRYELIEGELIMVPAPGTEHQRNAREILVKLYLFVNETGLGEVFFAPTDVILSEECVVQPDLLFISKERLNIIEKRGVFGPPDLVVEIISPSTALFDATTKRDIYERFGIREYWLVSPEEKMVEVFTLEEGRYKIFSQARQAGKIQSHLLAEFELDLKDIFF